MNLLNFFEVSINYQTNCSIYFCMKHSDKFSTGYGEHLIFVNIPPLEEEGSYTYYLKTQRILGLRTCGKVRTTPKE